MCKTFRIIFGVLPLLLRLQPLIAQAFNYTISGANVSPTATSYGAGDVITVLWTVNGGDAGFDRCYVAIRPVSDLNTDGALVVGQYNWLKCTVSWFSSQNT